MITPSEIISFFKQTPDEPWLWRELVGRLEVAHADKDDFKTIMQELIAKHTLLQNNQGLIFLNDPAFINTGKLQVSRKGYGFILPTGATDSIFVYADNLDDALDGDEVFFRMLSVLNVKEATRPEAAVVSVKSRPAVTVVGELKKNYARKFFLKIANINLQNYKNYIVNPQVGQPNYFYTATIVDYHHKTLFLKLERELGNAATQGIDILAVAEIHGIALTFDQPTHQAAQAIPSELTPAMITEAVARRLDVRQEPLVTIDGDDSKDFDDAVSVQQLSNGNWRLTVAIADVAHYVLPASPLDETARNRGFSSYLINQVIPMLPERLSNGICSLNPNVERLCMVCRMEFNSNGQIVAKTIHNGIMKSWGRLTYREVNVWWEDPSAPVAFNNDVQAMLKQAKTLYQILNNYKSQQGYVDFDAPETKIKVAANGDVVSIAKRVRGKAERMIEMFMVAANEAVASFIWKQHKPGIYRNHIKPGAEKIEFLTKYLDSFGFQVNLEAATMSAKDIRRCWLQLQDQDFRMDLAAPIFLRSMEKATYGVDNAGHFGLASNCYTHFTSPIRRYPDLIVHRLLKTYLETNDQPLPPLNKEQLNSIATITNQNELKSVECERAVNQMKIAEFMEKFVGQTFDGQISTVTKFGIFVALPNTIEGLVSLRSLTDDFYEYDANRFQLTGSKTGRTFRIGDPLKIVVKKASKWSRQIDFELPPPF